MFYLLWHRRYLIFMATVNIDIGEVFVTSVYNVTCMYVRMYVHTGLYWESVRLRSINQSGINRLESNKHCDYSQYLDRVISVPIFTLFIVQTWFSQKTLFPPHCGLKSWRVPVMSCLKFIHTWLCLMMQYLLYSTRSSRTFDRAMARI